MELDVLREKIAKFDALIRAALEEKHQGKVVRFPNGAESNVLVQWRLDTFVEAFVDGAVYSPERLEPAVYDLMDIKLQVYFITEVDLRQYSRVLYSMGHTEHSSTHHRLACASFDQTLRMKSRLLWACIMNFIYGLETGKRLDDQKSAKRSKRAAFFRMVQRTPRWRFMEPYEAEIRQYDNKFRTPELHKSSPTRVAALLGARLFGPETLHLINRDVNAIWENVIAIVGGKKPHAFTNVHFGPDGELDRRFLESCDSNSKRASGQTSCCARMGV